MKFPRAIDPMPCLALRRCTCERVLDTTWLVHYRKPDPTCIFHRAGFRRAKKKEEEREASASAAQRCL